MSSNDIDYEDEWLHEALITHTQELYDIIDDLRWKLENAKEIIKEYEKIAHSQK